MRERGVGGGVRSYNREKMSQDDNKKKREREVKRERYTWRQMVINISGTNSPVQA
jgi:hypothetical protein